MNLYVRYTRLRPRDPVLLGQVTAHNADGTSDVTLPDGSVLRPQGQSVAVSSYAFVQAGRVQGQAPDLTPAVTVNV